MLEFLSANWQVLLPAIGAVLVLFFPQFKPIFDLLVKKKPAPIPGPDGKPVDPDGERPTPVIDALKALLLVINHARTNGNVDAELAARDTAKRLFDQPKE